MYGTAKLWRGGRSALPQPPSAAANSPPHHNRAGTVQQQQHEDRRAPAGHRRLPAARHRPGPGARLTHRRQRETVMIYA